MSFSLDFYAQSADDAGKIVAQETHLPQSVRDFIASALKADPGPAYVKVWGHLYNNDFMTSTATIEVKPVSFRVPKG